MILFLFYSRMNTRGNCWLSSSAFIAILIVNNVTSERISQKKCREYAELVYAKEPLPILCIGGDSRIVSKCEIVETPLIVGGIKAKSMEFPHQALIGYGNEIYWQCGGSIISEYFILTAAHCTASHDRGPALKVRVGLINLEEPDDTMQERGIVQRIRHPHYKYPSNYNDLALLKVDEPFDLTPAVRPACLEANSSIIGEGFIASGFGKTAYDADSGSNELMKVTLDHVSIDTCRRVLESEIGSRKMRNGVLSSQLCAGIMQRGRDTCHGDSGGPLQRVLAEPYCMYSIVGVTSFGKSCAFKNSLGIYTRVSFYINWIEEVVWPNESTYFE